MSSLLLQPRKKTSDWRQTCKKVPTNRLKASFSSAVLKWRLWRSKSLCAQSGPNVWGRKMAMIWWWAWGWLQKNCDYFCCCWFSCFFFLGDYEIALESWVESNISQQSRAKQNQQHLREEEWPRKRAKKINCHWQLAQSEVKWRLLQFRLMFVAVVVTNRHSLVEVVVFYCLNDRLIGCQVSRRLTLAKTTKSVWCWFEQE